jgi:hypothetical protein
MFRFLFRFPEVFSLQVKVVGKVTEDNPGKEISL